MRFFDKHVRPYDHMDDDQLRNVLAKTRRQLRVADAPFAVQAGVLMILTGLICCVVVFLNHSTLLAWGVGPALLVTSIAGRVWRSTLVQQRIRQEDELDARAMSHQHVQQLHAGAFSGMMLLEASSYLSVRSDVLSITAEDLPPEAIRQSMEDALEERLFLLSQLRSQMDPDTYEAHIKLASVLLEGYSQLAKIVCDLDSQPRPALPGMEELAQLAQKVSETGRRLGADPRHLHDIDCLLDDIKQMQGF